MPFRLVRTSAAQALVELEKLLKSMPACVQARFRFAAKPWAKLAIGAATASLGSAPRPSSDPKTRLAHLPSDAPEHRLRGFA